MENRPLQLKKIQRPKGVRKLRWTRTAATGEVIPASVDGFTLYTDYCADEKSLEKSQSSSI